MKLISAILMLLLSVSITFAQKTSDITITSNKDLSKNYYLEFQGEGYRFEADKKTVNLSAVIENPEYGYIVSSNGRNYKFWYDEGKVEIHFQQNLFKNNLEVKGSTSHQIFENLRQASDFNRFKTVFAANSSSVVALDYINRYYEFRDFSNEEFKEIFQLISSEDYESITDFASYMNVIDQDKLIKNEQFIDFTGYDKDGKAYNSSDYRGQYLLIDVAATWCGPCWEAFPYMIENLEKYDNIQYLSINQDNEIDTWLARAKKRDLDINWPVIWEVKGGKKELLSRYEINAYPTYILVDPKGKVIERWDFSMKKYFNRKMKKYLN